MAAPKPAPQSPQPSPPCSLTRAPIPSSPSMQLISTSQSSTNHGLTTVTGSTPAPHRRIFTTSSLLTQPVPTIPKPPSQPQPFLLCFISQSPPYQSTKPISKSFSASPKSNLQSQKPNSAMAATNHNQIPLNSCSLCHRATCNFHHFNPQTTMKLRQLKHIVDCQLHRRAQSALRHIQSEQPVLFPAPPQSPVVGFLN
ncbi:hypothetical protein M0R45_009159 [Rubus argutus]|uniref:Uncharacterized protein n=1 Tax=Rubus argutus TaxID=59490 RepID=A0AAW1Y520_RUBAR